MHSAIAKIKETLEPLRQDESLLFLNHLLAVQKGYLQDDVTQSQLQCLRGRPIAHVVYFLAIKILYHSSIVGVPTLNFDTFLKLLMYVDEIPDPIQDDPQWKSANPTYFFERLLQQQMPSQQLGSLQKLGIFPHIYRHTPSGHTGSLQKVLENEIGMNLENFIKLGLVCGSLRLVKRTIGTFTYEYLTDAYAKGISISVPEDWRKFLDRVSWRPEDYRRLWTEKISEYPQFQFNPLRRKPIVQLKLNRFMALDRDLLIDRVTQGLFYDLFDAHKSRFSERFGTALEEFVGDLLKSVVTHGSFWHHSDCIDASRSPSKVADHAYWINDYMALFECKSLRPTLKVASAIDESSLDDVTNRVVAAIEQLIEHAASISAGDWVMHGIPQREVKAIVLVTYGRFYTVNSMWWRRAISDKCGADRLPPFVVLSLEELDSLLSLVDRGWMFDTVISTICEIPNILEAFPELKNHAVSSLTTSRGLALLESIRDE